MLGLRLFELGPSYLDPVRNQKVCSVCHSNRWGSHLAIGVDVSQLYEPLFFIPRPGVDWRHQSGKYCISNVFVQISLFSRGMLGSRGICRAKPGSNNTHTHPHTHTHTHTCRWLKQLCRWHVPLLEPQVLLIVRCGMSETCKVSRHSATVYRREVVRRGSRSDLAWPVRVDSKPSPKSFLY